MNTEFIEALKMLCKERGVEEELMFKAIEEALVSAYKREFDSRNADNVDAHIDRETGEMKVILTKEVVESVVDQQTEISLAEAKALSDAFDVGDLLEMEIDPQMLGRLAAQTAKNVINQRLSQAERERIQAEFSSRIGELAYGVVQRKDRREVIVDIGRAEAVLHHREQSRLDNYDFNRRMRFYILRVDEGRGRPVVLVSRSHANLVRRLFEQEVPEIANGVVEIVSIARDAGDRTKMAVYSHDPNVDPVGSCVGQRGMRVLNVIDELNGEKIDVMEWDENPEVFIANALNPARILHCELDEETRSARVIVPDHQLSLAIGRSGQNAKLAARLTGWKIDIKSESAQREEIESEFMSRFDRAIEAAEEDEEYESEE